MTGTKTEVDGMVLLSVVESMVVLEIAIVNVVLLFDPG